MKKETDLEVRAFVLKRFRVCLGLLPGIHCVANFVSNFITLKQLVLTPSPPALGRNMCLFRHCRSVLVGSFCWETEKSEQAVVSSAEFETWPCFITHTCPVLLSADPAVEFRDRLTWFEGLGWRVLFCWVLQDQFVSVRNCDLRPYYSVVWWYHPCYSVSLSNRFR
jgi:hypothetical protein